MRRVAFAAIGVVMGLSWWPSTALAQSTKPTRLRVPVVVSGKSASDPSVNSSQVLLLAWLDDAVTPEKGGGAVDVSVGRWQATDASQSDMPSVSFNYAVTDRLRLGASSSLSRSHYADGTATTGLDTTYLESKFQLVDPDEAIVGFAISPMIEILGNAVAKDPALNVSRVNWALPVTAHIGANRGAVYATGTYFSRGVLSIGGEVEFEVTDRLTVAGLATYAYATRLYFQSASETTSRSRTDIGAEAYYSFKESATMFATVGRTISQMDLNSAKWTGSIGMRFEWKAKKP